MSKSIKCGIALRNMGVQSTRQILQTCALAAQAMEFESIWVTDHIAIPPDDAVGSGGRYTDTLTTMAWLAGITQSINIGSGVLILPYRPALPTAKQIATIQELSADRVLLGVGVGWMDAEFRALGLNRHQRGKMTDQVLQVINDCFAEDEVVLNNQPLLFKPRPQKPAIYIGGRAPHAWHRATQFSAGWIPMVKNPAQLAPQLEAYRQYTAARDCPPGRVTAMTGTLFDTNGTLNLDEFSEAHNAFAALGVERVVYSIGYEDAQDFVARTEQIRQALEHL